MTLDPLTGFTVGVTAARRREELVALLERRGARVVEAPAIRIVPVEDDRQLVAATRECLSGVDIAVATTAIGFRGWLEAAESAGLADQLLRTLEKARVLTRGPKAKGAIRAVGLTEAWSPDSECTSEVLEHLLEHGVSDLRIAIQLHGEPLPEFVSALRHAGASVIEVPVYRWVLPDDIAPVERLVELIKLRQVDAVTFTSAPATSALMKVAGDSLVDVLEALRDDVLAACVGPVCAGPLERVGVPTIQPERARIGGLVRTLAERLPAHHTRELSVAGHRLEVRGHAAVVDGEPYALAPTQMAVLKLLAAVPGRVVPRTALLEGLPRGADAHAVEMAVARLRSGLGDAGIVRTVPKRGYCLAIDE